MHYVYLLESESAPNRRYTGYTNDLRQRAFLGDGHPEGVTLFVVSA